VLNWLLKVDTDLFLYLNNINSNLLDSFMLFISYNMIPGLIIIGIFLYLIIKEYKKKFIFPFIFILITFGLADSISSKLFKDNFKRLRPMHEPQIMKSVHTAKQGRGGGKYGFVSSHATNTFAICAFIFMFFRRKHPKFILLFVYAGIVSYSRIYLGKHYPLDIICGAMLGLCIAYMTFSVYLYLESNLIKPSQDRLQ
jgi:undecaprenyl-diphosphatase